MSCGWERNGDVEQRREKLLESLTVTTLRETALLPLGHTARGEPRLQFENLTLPTSTVRNSSVLGWLDPFIPHVSPHGFVNQSLCHPRSLGALHRAGIASVLLPKPHLVAAITAVQLY